MSLAEAESISSPPVVQRRRRSLSRPVETSGSGLHSGAPCRLRFVPAPPGYGVRFCRTDLEGAPQIPATLDSLVAGELQRRTTLACGDARVFTIEHILSATQALGIDDLLVEMNAPEPPFLDGSSAPFVELLQSARPVEHGEDPVEPVTLPSPLVFKDGNVEIAALPSQSLRVTYFFSSDQPLLRAQSATFVLDDPDVYIREIAPARTFCFFDEIEMLRRAGLIKGANLNSAIVIGRKAILNPSLRFPDEPVRHKILDFVGDLALLGRPLTGHYLVWRSGHRANCLFALHLRQRLGL